MQPQASRRSFLQTVGFGTFGAAMAAGALSAQADDKVGADILGKVGVESATRTQGKWEPISDRKIRFGIVGYGVCRFGAAFGFQDHPNVEIAAVSDLEPDRCANLAKACRASKTYPSLEELVKDDTIEAVFLATDAPSHCQHAITSLKHGKHVACAVPAVYGSLEDADKLYEAVRETGKKYMLFETSAFRPNCYAMRKIYEAGGFGKLIYTEGEYFHYHATPIPSYKDWRVGLPPQFYPTHSNAYYNCVTSQPFTEVSCLGMPSKLESFQPQNNRYGNPFGTEIAMFRTAEGGMARMAVSWDSQGAGREVGRVRGESGAMWDAPYVGDLKELPDVKMPVLPPGVNPGGHGGSHGQLTEEFISSILSDRQPLVDVTMALNLTVSGIVAHQSAMKGGETMSIPQYAPLTKST
ncbi:MAG: Gfo/Idh/MocA family protein [Blastopirellula sp. JB062]